MPDVLYISNWSLNEPLCQSQSVAYLKALAARGRRSCLITFERAPYAVPRGDVAAVERALSDIGICWHPVPYHRRTLLTGALDMGRGLAVALGALVRHRARIVHTRTSVPAAVGLLAARLTGRRFLYDADSELSEEYVDAGHWTRSSLSYRLLNRIEKTCRRRADAMVVLTSRLRDECLTARPGSAVTVIPCCVDVDGFRHDAAARHARRSALGIGSAKLLVYLGKQGPRYMVEETIEFAKAVRRRTNDARLLVLTHDDPVAFDAIARSRDFGEWMFVRRATAADVPSWLSAADAGIALIRPARSERGSSPVKISEYLAAGLPVVMTQGIGDISDAVERESLGVVVSQLTAAGLDAAAARLESLWSDEAAARRRCAAWATAEVDVGTVGAARYAAVYDSLGVPARSPAPEREWLA